MSKHLTTTACHFHCDNSTTEGEQVQQPPHFTNHTAPTPKKILKRSEFRTPFTFSEKPATSKKGCLLGKHKKQPSRTTVVHFSKKGISFSIAHKGSSPNHLQNPQRRKCNHRVTQYPLPPKQDE